MEILRELGVLPDVLAKSHETEAEDAGWFQFRSGLGNHEMIYEVESM